MAKVYFIGGGGGPSLSLSFDGSSKAEGTQLVAPAGTENVDVPIPVGVNKMHKIRWDSITVVGSGNSGLAFYELQAIRAQDGSLIFGASGSVTGGAVFPGFTTIADAVRFTLGGVVGQPTYYAWRWVLSPMFSVPFNIPILP
jgi:hypothetical protein